MSAKRVSCKIPRGTVVKIDGEKYGLMEHDAGSWFVLTEFDENGELVKTRYPLRGHKLTVPSLLYGEGVKGLIAAEALSCWHDSFASLGEAFRMDQEWTKLLVSFMLKLYFEGGRSLGGSEFYRGVPREIFLWIASPAERFRVFSTHECVLTWEQDYPGDLEEWLFGDIVTLFGEENEAAFMDLFPPFRNRS